MPFTFPAHQAPVLALKMWRPHWFDCTALVVGAAAPDLQWTFGDAFPFSAHDWSGLAFFSVPFTIVYATLLRRFAADGLFASLPDMGPLRLSSYRVISRRNPHMLTTISSAFVGAASHIALDSFTHYNRFGSNLLSLNSVVLDVNGGITVAKSLQYTSHTLGSVVGLACFAFIVSRGPLASWYGEEVVAQACSAAVRVGARRRTLGILAVSIVVAVVWSIALTGVSGFIFNLGAFAALGLLAAGIANRPPAYGPLDTEPRLHRETPPV